MIQSVIDAIRYTPQTWLVTGVAGFIGSNLLEFLLQHGQKVVGVDNFATGHRSNLELVRNLVSEDSWRNFTLVEGDVSEQVLCSRLFDSPVDHVLHQAALGSVPRSIENPLATNIANVNGFLNMLWYAEQAEVKSFVYAASSSTYGDHPDLPKTEPNIGNPLSPYAVTKYVNEIYADVFKRSYGFRATGLRYFNVFGPRQDPNGAYAAVIPRWMQAMITDKDVIINGDGETSRDFCYVENVVQANVLAALAQGDAKGEVYNVAVGMRTTLNQLFGSIKDSLQRHGVAYNRLPIYQDFRAGDVRHSLADITRAKVLLGYCPTHELSEGIEKTVTWFLENSAA